MSKRKIKSVTWFGTLECWSHFSSFNLFFRFHPFSSIMQHPSQQIGGISDISKYPHLRQLWPSHDANNLLPGSFQVFFSFFSSSFSSFFKLFVFRFHPSKVRTWDNFDPQQCKQPVARILECMNTWQESFF